MISVSISINGNPIFTRSAVNTDKKDSKGNTIYKMDDGSIIKHKPEQGAVELAKKMLNRIDEKGMEGQK